MAKIISHVWSVARGKVAGIVYLSGPGNPIIARQYVIPVNPNTSGQSGSRDSFNAAVKRWTAASAEFRDGYNQWAEAFGLPGGGRRQWIKNCSFWGYLVQKGIVSGNLPFEIPNEYGEPGFYVEQVPYEGPEEGSFGVSFKIENINSVTANISIQRSVQFGPGRYRFGGPFGIYVNSYTFTANEVQTINIPIADGVSDNAVFIRIKPWVTLTGGGNGFFTGSPATYRSTVLEFS